MNEQLDMACFQIISMAGTARSNYILAIDAAEEGDFDKAQALIEEGDKAFSVCLSAHSKVIHMEETGALREPNLLLLHSEDQMMSAEAFKTMGEKFISLYKRVPKEG